MENKIYVRHSLKNLFCLIALFIFSAHSKAQTFPTGFSQVQIPGIYYPTSMAFAPDGRIFVTEKAGHVRIVKNGLVLSAPFATVTVDQFNERGLSSVCLDPNFNSNHYVYVYYTSTSGSIHNRLSRFTASGDEAVPGSEQILLEFEPLVNSIHNSGGMAFGLDGKLFLAVGNDNVNSNSQDLNNYKGKILRINPDGSVPSGNPFTGSESAKRIWAYGLRNPWTIALQPGTGKLYVDDVGEATWEEINDATVAGRNFGWPATEGATTNPAYTSPVYTYHHGTSGSDQGCAITGGTFFNPTTSNYPAMYAGKYFFIDYCGQWINYIDISSGTAVKQNFASNLPSAGNYIKVGYDGNLYYFSISQNSLYKIIYSGSSSAPAITTQPSNASVPLGQNVTFSVTASGTNPLSYQWRKNGTNISGAIAASYTKTNVQYSDAGQYSCVVTNSLGSATSNNAVLTVTAPNAKPTATILSPGSGTFYRDGDVIHFSGDGTDPEDGTLPASAFNWYVEFHHATHYHPGPFIPAGIKTGSFNATFGSEIAANVFFRLVLVVSDAQSQTDTAYVDIHPVTSTLTINSQPSGLSFTLEGIPHTTPYSVLAVSGMHRSISATTPQTFGDSNYVYNHWSQGGAASQTFVVTDANQTFKAFYTTSGGSTPVVTITAPSGGTTYSNPSNIAITANASSAGGTITKVQFFENGTLLGQDLTAPYSFIWNGATTGSYALTAKATNNTGQVGTSAAVNITVAGCPTPVITAAGPTTMCSGSVVLKTTTAPGNMYQWKKDGTNISGASAANYTASVSGDYQVKVINGSCVGWSAPTTVRIQSGLSASITPGGPTTFCMGGNVKLYANTCSGYTYQWIKNGVNISGATASVYTATSAGSYQLMTRLSGSSAWSALLNVHVNTCMGNELLTDDGTEDLGKSLTTITEESTGRFEMKVYPNPNNGSFTIMLNIATSREEKVKMRIVNLLGQEIYNKEFIAGDTSLREIVDLDSSLPVGIYTLQVVMGEKTESTSIVLAR